MMSTLYTPEFLAALSDEDALGHYEWTLGDCGEQDPGFQRLKAECERRGLIETVPVGPPADGTHFATSACDFAVLIDALDGQGDKWTEAIYADAAAQGISREAIDTALQQLTGSVEVANDPV
jgi:hypothetical protein